MLVIFLPIKVFRLMYAHSNFRRDNDFMSKSQGKRGFPYDRLMSGFVSS